MAKGRMLVKDISYDKRISKLSDKTANIFFHMIPHQEADGLLERDPEIIKVKCLPFTNHTVEDVEMALIDLLATTPQIVSEIEGNKKMLKFSDFWIANEGLVKPSRFSRNSRNSRFSEKPYKRTQLRKEVIHTHNGDSEGFNVFWSNYPKRIGKGAAESSWRKLHPSQELKQTIMAALDKQKRSDQWTKESGRFIPLPATWLNQKRWEDDLAPVRRGIDYEKD